MLKEFNKFKLNHNNFDAGVRGTWRKFNPYNPDAGLEDSEPIKDLNVDSLDDLFDDDDDIKETSESKGITSIGSRDYSTNEIKVSNNQNSNEISDNDLDELLFDDEILEENDDGNNEVLDIQKELEAKFDELFGDSDNN